MYSVAQTVQLSSEAKRLNTKRDGPARLLPALAGADSIFQWIGMLEYIPCYSGPTEHRGLLPATRLASREILIEQNIKKRTGPSLCAEVYTPCGVEGLQCNVLYRPSLLNCRYLDRVKPLEFLTSL